jgi:hypothetical protein
MVTWLIMANDKTNITELAPFFAEQAPRITTVKGFNPNHKSIDEIENKLVANSAKRNGLTLEQARTSLKARGHIR